MRFSRYILENVNVSSSPNQQQEYWGSRYTRLNGKYNNIKNKNKGSYIDKNARMKAGTNADTYMGNKAKMNTGTNPSSTLPLNSLPQILSPSPPPPLKQGTSPPNQGTSPPNQGTPPPNQGTPPNKRGNNTLFKRVGVGLGVAAALKLGYDFLKRKKKKDDSVE